MRLQRFTVSPINSLGVALFLYLCVFGMFTACNTGVAEEAPPRIPRAEAFLGIHFDFHAGPDCTQVGARTTPEMVETIIDKVRPDFIQIDCKGHPGYSSYPTKVGNPAPGFVGDPLVVWREVTKRRGVSLFMHYSGVWDGRAVELHPEWAAVQANGKPHERATSVFGPYVDELMIPQLRELADVYGVDGVWVDGDCWATVPDYRERVVKMFCEQTGATAAPKGPGEPYWFEWLEFHREGFRRYLRHYVDAMKASHPQFQVISNWAFSDHMPEPVSADVVSLSGDFSPDDSVNSARFAGRCIENQGMPWDLMSWSFSRKTWRQKPAAQLKQEAAVVLAMGGGYQAYFRQDRDGAVKDLSQMDTMAEVAEFCRARQSFCHRSKAVPQVALLYSTAGHYRTSNRLFHWSEPHVVVLRQALTAILQENYGVQIVSEHHVRGHVRDWPIVVVPDWDYLEPDFRDELAAYADDGGKLLLVGEGPAALFAHKLESHAANIVAVPAVDERFTAALRRLFPDPIVTVTGSSDVDVSPRTLDGVLSIHLVNTSGPHANPPEDGIREIEPIGPLTVSVRLAAEPKAIVLQPEGKALPFTWRDGRAVTTVDQLPIYSILVVQQ
ncbi:hypothetical protein JCM19992_34720 [Thermostilla marina]